VGDFRLNGSGSLQREREGSINHILGVTLYFCLQNSVEILLGDQYVEGMMNIWDGDNFPHENLLIDGYHGKRNYVNGADKSSDNPGFFRPCTGCIV
jgi:hypothetical protein